MTSLLLFAIGVMYTPGPVNILSLNAGIQRGVLSHAAFCLGVSAGMFWWFFAVGFLGTALVNDTTMPLVAGLGSAFILYLAVKIITAEVSADGNTDGRLMGFTDGLLLQSLNPKTLLVVVPVTTVHFPALGVTGWGIVPMAAMLSALGFGAPFLYSVFGASIARRTASLTAFKYFNYAMGLMLVLLAADMAYEHVYPALRAL